MLKFHILMCSNASLYVVLYCFNRYMSQYRSTSMSFQNGNCPGFTFDWTYLQHCYKVADVHKLTPVGCKQWIKFGIWQANEAQQLIFFCAVVIIISTPNTKERESERAGYIRIDLSDLVACRQWLNSADVGMYIKTYTGYSTLFWKV